MTAVFSFSFFVGHVWFSVFDMRSFEYWIVAESDKLKVIREIPKLNKLLY